MNKFITVSAISLFVSVAQAQPVRLVSSDGSMLSTLCIAAANSAQSAYETAAIYGIRRQEVDEIRCNGISLQRFVSKFRSRNTLGNNDRAAQMKSRITTSRQ